MKILCSAALLALGTLALPALADGDAAAGRDKTTMCEGCHGIEGYRTAFPDVYHVPRLGGQNAAYIVKALKEYQSGGRSHPSMKAIAGSLTEKDMEDLAAYYSGGAAKSASSK